MRMLGRDSILPVLPRLLITASAVFALAASTADAGPAPPGSRFFAVSPCRVLDTRLPTGPQGGPALAADEIRIFPLTGTCGIPLTATAVSGSLIAIKPGASGLVRVYPGDITEPATLTIAFGAGQTRAGNGLFLLATNGTGTLAVHNVSAGPVDFVFDVNGYFDATCPPIAVNPATLPSVADGTPVNQALTTSGGVGPFTFAVTSGALPGGVTLSPAGVLSGTATASGSFNFTATATDFNNCTGARAYTLVLTCPTITVTPTTLSPGAVGVPYGPVTFTQTGAVGGVTWSFTGTLPTGVTLSAAGVLSGTPTQGGTFPITVKATDAGGCFGTVNVTLSTCPALTVTNPATSAATAGSPFSQNFTQAGGALPVSFSLATGVLPTGMTLAANGTLSGPATQTGTFPITVKATDVNGCTGTGSVYPLVVSCGTVTVTNPATTTGTANAAFSQTFTQSGGVGAVAFTLSSGTLPTGLTLAANGTLSGTPTQKGNFPITVKATDVNTCNGTGTTYTLVISCQVITVTKPAVAAGTISTFFSQTFTQSNAIGTATFTTASTLPSGLSLSTTGVLSGTPTQPGGFPIVVIVTDANGCTGTSTTYTLVIGCQSILVANPATATGTVSTPFSQTFTQSGAVGGATFTTASTLPAGLSLSTSGVLSGTPTQKGSFPIVVTVTDGNGCTGTGATYTLVVGCQNFSIGPASLPQVTVSVPFPAFTFTQTGGIGTTTFTTASALNGLSLATNGTLSGTPTATGSFPITVTATDANGCTASRDYLLVVACSGTSITLSPGSLPTAPANAPYPTTTFTASGGTGPYTFQKAGVLPAGMSFVTDTLSGTPTQTGTFPFTVSATDAAGCTGSQDYVVTITCTGVTITVAPSSLASGPVGSPYGPITFTASGGTSPYTLAEVGALPPGMTFAGGVLSGTPTQPGTFPVTVTAKDANGCTGQTVYSLVTTCPTITVTSPSTTTGTVDAAFSQTFTQSGASGTATFTTTSTLPGGLTLSTAGVLSGTPGQPGSYPIVVKVTDANGCTGTSATYTLVISCQTITVTKPATATGTVDAAFSQTFTQSGVGLHTPATFTTASTLPTGLTLSSSGVLSGTPGQPGSFPIVVTVTDANGCTGTSTTYSLVLSCQTITVTKPVVTTGTYNTAFSQTFTQSGVGTHTPATFTTASSLPTGLSLSTAGVLSGTPTQTGSFPIVVTVTDANGCTGTSASYALTIAPKLTAKAYTDVANTQLSGGVAVATPAVSVVAVSNGDTADVAITYAVTVSPTHGTLTTFNTNGTFLYTPTAGNTTSDAFTYTGTSNGVSATQTATIAFSGRVWYVQAGGAAGDGRSNTPFSSLASAGSPTSGIGDLIYVEKETSGNTPGNLTMQTSQKLIGAGATLNAGGGILVITGLAGNTPTLSGTLTLASSVVVNGIDMSTGASNAIAGNGVTGISVTARTVATTTGIAINLTGAGNTGTMTFTSVSANGASNGINIQSLTGGSFTILGTGSAGSGGTIQSSTGDGLVLTGVASPSLSWMNITDSAGGAADDGLVLTNITGTVTIDQCTITNAPHNGITVDNNNTNMTAFNLTNSIVQCQAGQPCQPSGSIGNDGLLLVMRGTSVLTSGVVSGSTFNGVRAVAIQIQTNDSGRIGSNSGGTITNSFTVQNNTFTGNGQGIDIDESQISNLTFQVLNNTVTGSDSVAINAFTAAGADTGPTAHTFVGKIDGNTIGTQGVKDSGSRIGSGIRVVVQGTATQGIVTVNNNTLREVVNADMMTFIGQNGAASSPSSTARFKITNNTLPAASGSTQSLCGPANTPCAGAGIFVLADEGAPVCNIITGNSIFDVTTMNGSFDVYLAERAGPPAGAQLTVEGSGVVTTFIDANNTLAGASKSLDEAGNVTTVAVACGVFP